MTGPADEAGVIEVVAQARRDGAPLLVCGNASKAAMLRPVQAARTLSLRSLSGITLHSPQELVLQARAGTLLAEVEQAAADAGQMLVAEPPDLSVLLGSAAPPTIGGIVAANLSGPRRVAWGAVRDHLLGVRAVSGRAELLRSGGRVLKNVTGLDLCKLFAGSHGTLAVLTEVTLKVLPAPERVGTVRLRGLPPDRAVRALAAALGSPYAVSGAAHLPDADGGPATLARIEDFEPSVAYRTERLRQDLAEFGAADILDDTASRALWRQVRDAAPLANALLADAPFAEQAGGIWRVSVRPSKGPDVAQAAAALGARWFMDWGGGLVWIAAPATEAAHRTIIQAARAARGTWTLMRGPEALRAAVEVIPPEPPALAAITQRVKLAFDPDRILNPGRLYAGL